MESYQTITLFIAALAFITGVLLLTFPHVLIRAGELFNRVYNVESLIYGQRKLFGLMFLAGGIILIYFLW
jgi:hypothetical protein